LGCYRTCLNKDVIIEKVCMQNKILSIDNYVFLLSTLISSAICYFLLSPMDAVLGGISVFFTFVIYSAKPNNGDYAYTFFWIVIILLGCYVGIWLKLSVWFYLFLFAISSYYYISYQRDSFSDRAIPFMVIYASLGTTMKELNYQSAIAFLIGSIVALTVMGIAHKNKIKFTAFKAGLFSKSFYITPTHIRLHALVYSAFLFLCLYLPDQMGFARPYWVPMTFIILLKPKEENLVKNTLTRFWGSIIGAITVVTILKVGAHYEVIKIVFLLVFIFLVPSFFKMSNLTKTFGTTTFVLLLLETSIYWHEPNYTLPDTRIFETFIGGALAIVASIVLRMMRKRNIKFQNRTY